MAQQTPMSVEQRPQLQSGPDCCPVVELRQYTLYPGQRDVLIELFDRAFIASQEAAGMRIIGQFRDLDRPDRFVWLRGFQDMPARARALQEFYSGPVWRAHRDAANATMVDSNNVLLLRPARPGSGFRLSSCERPASGSSAAPRGLLLAMIYTLAGPATAELADLFEHTARPLLAQSGADVLATFVTEQHPNTFPALPVREGEHVLVSFTRVQGAAAYAQHAGILARSQRWRGELAEALAGWLTQPPELLRLAPTSRSLLRG